MPQPVGPHIDEISTKTLPPPPKTLLSLLLASGTSASLTFPLLLLLLFNEFDLYSHTS